MKREKYINKFHKRWERVARLREVKGLTFEEIGKKFNPPVSRQRASQMYDSWTELQDRAFKELTK